MTAKQQAFKDIRDDINAQLKKLSTGQNIMLNWDEVDKNMQYLEPDYEDDEREFILFPSSIEPLNRSILNQGMNSEFGDLGKALSI